MRSFIAAIVLSSLLGCKSNAGRDGSADLLADKAGDKQWACAWEDKESANYYDRIYIYGSSPSVSSLTKAVLYTNDSNSSQTWQIDAGESREDGNSLTIAGSNKNKMTDNGVAITGGIELSIRLGANKKISLARNARAPKDLQSSPGTISGFDSQLSFVAVVKQVGTLPTIKQEEQNKSVVCLKVK